MITFHQFIELDEHVLSIGLNPAHAKYREQYRHEIHDMLHHAYKPLGGYSGHESGTKKESDTIHNDITQHYIKAVRRNGKISAVTLYKDKNGRKLIGGGTDDTPQGKVDLKKTMADDNHQKRAWGEFSGAIEKIGNRLNYPTVSNRHAEKLTGKPDVEHDDDGVHYTRQIGDKRRRKIIMGHPKLD